MLARQLVFAVGALALAACTDGMGPAGTSQVAFAISTHASGSGAAGPTAVSEVFNDSSGNSISIDSVSVVVRKLELEGSSASCPSTGEDSLTDDVAVGGMIQASDSAEHEGDDDCGEVRAGPFLVDLPLGTAGAERQFSVTVDTGTYTRVKIQIHTPDGEHDVLFLQQHPEFAGVSIRVVGTFNGAPFTYTTGITDVQEVQFATPLVVGSSPTAFTLFVDLSGWFKGEGGALIDPATATGDGANVLQVRWNILHSFHAFQDTDHDGEDDHTEGGMH
jgi:hypothetical protein